MIESKGKILYERTLQLEFIKARYLAPYCSKFTIMTYQITYQETLTFSKSTIETLEKGAKSKLTIKAPERRH